MTSQLNNVTVVMNFVCTEEKRLNFVLKNIVDWASVLEDCHFNINFNDSINLAPIQNIFEKNIPKLNFSNMQEKDFALTTYNISTDIKTPYVLFLCEDCIFNMTKDDLSNILQEVADKDVDFVNLTKLEKYNRSNYRKQGKYVEGKYGHFYKGRNSPSSRLSIQAMFKTELWLNYFKNFLENRDRPWPHSLKFKYTNLPNCIEGYYDFSLGPQKNPLFTELNCYIPKKIIFDHWDETKQKYTYIKNEI